jgi:hypothetical protein
MTVVVSILAVVLVAAVMASVGMLLHISASSWRFCPLLVIDFIRSGNFDPAPIEDEPPI